MHHHGPLAGLTAGAAAILAGFLFAGVLVLAVWRHIAGQVSAAVAVVIWALVALVVGVVAALLVYAALFIRHRVLHPETLTRTTVRAEVIDPPAPLEIPPAALAGELTAGPLWRLNPHSTPEPHTIPGTAGDDTTGRK